MKSTTVFARPKTYLILCCHQNCKTFCVIPNKILWFFVNLRWITWVRFHQIQARLSRIWRKIMKNLTYGIPDRCGVTSYLASHWSDFSGCCVISWNLNLMKLDSWTAVNGCTKPIKPSSIGFLSMSNILILFCGSRKWPNPPLSLAGKTKIECFWWVS